MRNKTTTAKFVAASVAGYLHIGQKLPCQDYYKYVTGRNIVAVLSDGAGSAKYGKIGAKNLCNVMCDLLKNADFNHIEDQIIHAVKVVRQKLMMHRLNKTKNEQGLAPFSATLVGVVYKGNKGIFFHIGDGAAVTLHPDSTFTASRPENGNFTCETFFFTQLAWRENLRFTKFENAKSIMLMSDGLTSFAFRSGFSALEHEFIMPINSFLSEEKSITKAKKALSNTLNTPRAQKLNPDDKTLVWIKVA